MLWEMNLQPTIIISRDRGRASLVEWFDSANASLRGGHERSHGPCKDWQDGCRVHVRALLSLVFILRDERDEHQRW